MSLEAFLNTTKMTVQENSPSILAALAVGGVATTGLLAYSAGRRYQHEVELFERAGEDVTSGKAKFELGWRKVIVPTGAAVLTMAAIIAGTAISNRRNAALAGLVTLGEISFREYRDKVEKVVSKQKREEVEREVAQEKLDKSNSTEVYVIGEGDILLFDTLTSRIFKGTELAIKQAEVELNRKLLGDDYVSQNQWYDEIGLPRVSLGDDIGWNHDTPFEVKFIPLIRDSKPVMGIDYRFLPISNFDRFN